MWHYSFALVPLGSPGLGREGGQGEHCPLHADVLEAACLSLEACSRQALGTCLPCWSLSSSKVEPGHGQLCSVPSRGQIPFKRGFGEIQRKPLEKKEHGDSNYSSERSGKSPKLLTRN